MLLKPESEYIELPVTPDEQTWRAMSDAAKAGFHEQVIEALNQQARLQPEGRPHSVAKMSAASTLSNFFERVGRNMYLASELPVDYPGETPFAPDLIAVSDVEDPGWQDPRMAWVVVDEGRGIDFALEILHAGNRHKDLVENVARFARLGIPEYFVYDRARQRIYGWHLPIPATRRYQSIPERHGVIHSRVLGLGLGVMDNRLRFQYGDALVPEARELIARLDALMTERQDRLEELTEQLEEERRGREEERLGREEERLGREEERLGREEERLGREEERRLREVERLGREQERLRREEAEARLAELLRRLGES